MRHGSKDEKGSPRKKISEGEEGGSGEAFVELWTDELEVHATGVTGTFSRKQRSEEGEGAPLVGRNRDSPFLQPPQTLIRPEA